MEGFQWNPAFTSPPDGSAYAIPLLPELDLNQLALPCGSYELPPLPQWAHSPHACYDGLNYLEEILPLANSDASKSVHSPLSYLSSPNEMAEFENTSQTQSELQPDYLSPDMHSSKARLLGPRNEVVPYEEICGQTYNQWSVTRNRNNCPDPLPYSRAKVSASGCLSKNKSSPRERATENDRIRKFKIDERLQALQKELPQLKEIDKASLMDHIIDYIKLLQLQIKDLSKSRLGGESTSDSFVFLQGCGHFFLHQDMHHEPLEEMLEKLFVVDPCAATRLLQSRGLFVMPIALAEDLSYSL